MTNYTILEGEKLNEVINNNNWERDQFNEATKLLHDVTGYKAVVFKWHGDLHVGMLQEATGWIFQTRRESSKYMSLWLFKEPNQFVDCSDDLVYNKWLQDGKMAMLPKPNNFSKLTQKVIDQWAEYLEQEAMTAQLFNVWRRQDVDNKTQRAEKRLTDAGFKKINNIVTDENRWEKVHNSIRCVATIYRDGQVHRRFELHYGYLDMPEFCPEVNND